MKLNELITYLNEIAPYETAADWDNVGLLAGCEETEITRVLLALDITPAVVTEAKEQNAQLIISHHPVIFEPLRSLRPGSAPYLLAKHDIAALCLHTNLDRAAQGVNTALGEALGLSDCALYPDDFLLVGNTDRTYAAADFAARVKERLHAPDVRFTDGTVSRIALSSGGGGEGVALAAQYGCDAFLTGELKHHQYLAAREAGIAAFDAGHFSTEDVVIEPLKAMLAARFPETTFCKSLRCTCPYLSV